MPYTPPKIEAVNYPAPANAMAQRALAHITDLIFHHTAGPAVQSALAIDVEHRDEGWAMIGYNYVIGHDGTIYAARPVVYVPAAAYGRNSQSINVVLTGNFQEGDPGYTGPPTAAQVASATHLSIWLHKQFPSISRTIGHCDVATLFFPNDTGPYSTACPGNEFYKLLPQLKHDTLASMKAT